MSCHISACSRNLFLEVLAEPGWVVLLYIISPVFHFDLAHYESFSEHVLVLSSEKLIKTQKENKNSKFVCTLSVPQPGL
jgi:hypothetical protein